jgi:hypothetical protein
MLPVSCFGSPGRVGRGLHCSQLMGGHSGRDASIFCTVALFAALRHVASHGGHVVQSSGTSAQSSSVLHARAGLLGSSGRGGTANAGGAVAARAVAAGLVAGGGAGGAGCFGSIDSIDARGSGAGVSQHAANAATTKSARVAFIGTS